MSDIQPPPGTITAPGKLEFARDVVLTALRAPRAILPKRRLPVDGAGLAVMLLPGFGASANSMIPIRRQLQRANFDCHQWGLGRNHGRVQALLPQVIERSRTLTDETGKPVALVGWSLGGYLAREAARELPELVSQVVTFGTPAWGGPKHTVTANWYRNNGHANDEIERATLERFETPIQQPITAIYSKRDGVVAWQCCIDHWSPNITHIEVQTPHMAMGVDSRVIQLVGQALAR